MSISDKKFGLSQPTRWLILFAIVFVCLAPGRYDQAVLGWLSGGIFGSSVELNVEIKRGPRQIEGNFGTVHITNLSPKPVEVTEVRINRRQDAACSWKGTYKIGTGEEMVVSLIPAMMGLCGGTMSIISVVTDKGAADYTMRW